MFVVYLLGMGWLIGDPYWRLLIFILLHITPFPVICIQNNILSSTYFGFRFRLDATSSFSTISQKGGVVVCVNFIYIPAVCHVHPRLLRIVGYRVLYAYDFVCVVNKKKKNNEYFLFLKLCKYLLSKIYRATGTNDNKKASLKVSRSFFLIVNRIGVPCPNLPTPFWKSTF